MNRVRQATTVNIGYCGNCRHPHIVLCDDAHQPFAEAVVSESIGRRLIADLQRALTERSEMMMRHEH